MNPSYFSPIANHLWQSTLFAGVAGLLTLALRKNRARVRHGLWLAASCKFLIPLSVLMALGSHIQWRSAPATTPSNLSIVVGQVSMPFTTPAVSLPLLTTQPAAASPLPPVLWGVWGCGFLGLTFAWWVPWRRIRATVLSGSPVGLELSIRAMASPTLLEPGVFGVFRPVLFLPEGIFDRLTPAQLEAVVAHELCHVRHRDNLIAAVHMFVETVFWFHPLVWWIGKRMVEERERACDEEVLRMGNEPRVYAEGILNVCRLYVESPLVCVAGATGSDLRKRVEEIMQNRAAARLNFAGKAALALAGVTALAAPVVIGIMNAPAVQAQSPAAGRPRFEAASIKPTSLQGPDMEGLGDVRTFPGGRLVAEKVLLRYFIQNAYDVKPFQISGGPAWINSAHYDIDAKAEGNPNSGQMRLMMQGLLEDRFQLKLHHETRELPVYELTAARGGIKLQEPKPGSCPSPDPDAPPLPPLPGQAIPCGRVVMSISPSGARLQGGQVSMADLIRTLSNVLGRTVVDRTGFSGMFDVRLEFTPDESLGGLHVPPPRPAAPSDATAAAQSPDLHGGIFAAMQEQLGLKLGSAKGPVDVVVIDSVEKPSAN